jgi:hypothetical protein
MEKQMNTVRNLIAVAIVAAFPLSVGAQTTGSEVQRDVNQQQRIEQGLQSGSLTTREASKLEKEESQVNRMESRALKDGKLSDAEKARIQNAQNRVSRDIEKDKHNAQTGNPNSASSKRMQADVQRNVNQEKRIEQGVRSGQLTNREAGRLERGQANVDRREARAGADGHVGRAEERGIQSAENRQSRQIFNQKHDSQKK